MKIGGQIEVLLGFAPDRLAFQNAIKGTHQTQLVELTGKRAGEAKLTEVTSSAPGKVDAKLVEVDGKQKIEVTLKADQEGHISGQITAKTNLDSPKDLRLFFSAMVTGDLVLRPSFAFFQDMVDDKPPPSIPIELTSVGKKPFKVLRVEDKEGFVTGKPEKAENGYRVVLTLAKKPPQNRGKITIATDRPDQAALELNYSIRGPMKALPPGLLKTDRIPAPGLQIKAIPAGPRNLPIQTQSLKLNELRRELPPPNATPAPPSR